MKCTEGSSETEPSFNTETGSPIRGAFTLALVMLQERLANIPDNERRLILPTIEHLNWDVSHTFWRGSVMRDDGLALSDSAYAPSRAASRILLHMTVHWRNLGISREDRTDLVVSTSDVIELTRIASGPARVAFSKEEQIHIHNRLKSLLASKHTLNIEEREQSFRFVTNFLKGESYV